MGKSILLVTLRTGLATALLGAWPGTALAADGLISSADYPSIQAALDANPGREVYVPSGDHLLSAALRITADGSSLAGPGRIIQTNAAAAIIEIEGASRVRVRDLTVTRPEGAMETGQPGIRVRRSRNVVLSDLQVLDNRCDSAAIHAEHCSVLEIRGCHIENYSRIAVDDRRRTPRHPDFENYGYAFNCINGTGIIVAATRGVVIRDNRVIERRLLPTPELKAQHRLGDFVARDPKKGRIISQKTWDEGYVKNWHQGSAIQVTSPKESECVQVTGNYIENAAQGIDLHADFVIVAQNIVNNAFMGMKAMHGSRQVLIIGNQFLRNDLWSIGLMPGTASHGARPAGDGRPAAGPNADGGSIIAHNVIADFGYGTAHWIWGADNAPLRFGRSPLPENPPLRGVQVTGNVIHDPGPDGVAEGDGFRPAPPRYKHAVLIESGDGQPQGLHFSANQFAPGTAGVGNVPLPE